MHCTLSELQAALEACKRWPEGMGDFWFSHVTKFEGWNVVLARLADPEQVKLG